MFLLFCFLLIIIILSVSSSPSWIGIERAISWEQDRQDSNETPSTLPISLTTNPANIACIYDKVKVQWKVSEFNDTEIPFSLKNIYLIHTTLENRQMAVAAPLGSLLSQKPFTAEEESYMIYKIRCLSSTDIFCQPNPMDITLMKDYNIISMNFDRNTTMPSVPLDLLYHAITIQPPPQHPTRLQWLSPTSVRIHLDPIDMEHLVTKFQQDATSVSLKVTPIDTTLSVFHQGQKNVRVLRPSVSSKFYFIDGQRGIRVSNIVELQIKSCHDDEDEDESGDNYNMHAAPETMLLPNILPGPQRLSNLASKTESTTNLISLSDFHDGKDRMQQDKDATNGGEEMSFKKVDVETKAHATAAPFHMAGIYPITGTDTIKVTNKAVPALLDGTWSLSFWIRLLEAPTGSFRAILYKGDLQSTSTNFHYPPRLQPDLQRTPSLWLQPTTNHLSLHLSTLSYHDHSFSSVQEVPMNVWTHIVLTMENTTFIRESLSESGIASSSMDDTKAKKKKKNRKNVHVNEQDKLPVARSIGAKNNKNSQEDSSSNKRHAYRFRLYINGKCDLDGVAGIDDMIMGNKHPLSLFYDNTFAGPKSFIQGLSVWNGVLNAEDVLLQYLSGAQGTQTLDNTLHVLTQAQNPLLPFIAQYNAIVKAERVQKHKNSPPLATNNEEAKTTDDYAKTKEYIYEAFAQHGIVMLPEAETLSTSTSTVVGVIGDNLQQSAEQIVDGDRDEIEISAPLYEFFAKKSQESITNCESYDERLDIHAESAELGASRGLVHWSQLLLQGYEVSDSHCGYAAMVKDLQKTMLKNEQKKKKALTSNGDSNNHEASKETTEAGNINSEALFRAKNVPAALQPLVSGALGLQYALDAGDKQAIVPLAMLLLQGGLGLDGLLFPALNAYNASNDQQDNQNKKKRGVTNEWVADDWQVPWKKTSSSGSHLPYKQRNIAHAIAAYLQQQSRSQPHKRSRSRSRSRRLQSKERKHDHSMPMFARHVLQPTVLTTNIHNTTLAAATQTKDEEDSFAMYQENIAMWSQTPQTTRIWAQMRQLGVGLLYLGALYGQGEACVGLSYRYKQGIDGVLQDGETAAWYATLPVKQTTLYFQQQGAQSVIEAHRINDDTVRDLGKGNSGQDDELIELQRIRAKEGDVDAMLAMGDLYYYGARGLPQDHTQALRYFQQAANTGNAQGMCGVANMFLKGEGTPANVSAAIHWYEKATELDSVRAYNGLGYMYFYGQQVERNYTQALQYFVHAASYENDGDSLYNAAYCLEQGYGVYAEDDLIDDSSSSNNDVEANKRIIHERREKKREAAVAKAVYFYQVAARKLGHFGSIQTLGFMHLEGRGVERSSSLAYDYFSPALGIGPWAQWLRRGFDLFLTAQELAASSGSIGSSAQALTSSTGLLTQGWNQIWSSLAITSSNNNNKDENRGRNNIATVTKDTLYLQSLLCYLFVAELGQEVAQSNAAYILRTKLLSPTSSFRAALSPSSSVTDATKKAHGNNAATTSSSSSKNKDSVDTTMWVTRVALEHSLGYQLLRTAEIHQQAEAWLQVGNLFFPRQTNAHAADIEASTTNGDDSENVSETEELEEVSFLMDDYQQLVSTSSSTSSWIAPSYARALYCYQRAVSLSAHPVALVYLGVMHHFGLGMAEPQPERAGRYYNWALTTSTTNGNTNHQMKLTKEMQWVVASLQTALQWNAAGTNSGLKSGSSLFGQTVHHGLEYFVKLLWQ